MTNVKVTAITMIALLTCLFSAIGEEAQAQVTRMYRDSVKTHATIPPRLKKTPPLRLPDGLLEIARERILKKAPPCDISAIKRVGIAPLPSPMPRPHQQRIGIAPNPSPRPVPHHIRVGLAPLPSPSPRADRAGLDSIVDPIYKDVGSVNSPALLNLLIDMHVEAVRQGDLDDADLLEELIVVWPEY